MISTLPTAEWLHRPTNKMASDLGLGAETNFPARYYGVPLVP